MIVDAALGSAKNTSVELNWHLCPGEVIFDAYGSNAYGCHTGFADGNNMMFKTFCFSGERGLVPDTAFEASTGTSYTSSEINEKTARHYYRTAVDIGASNTPACAGAGSNITVFPYCFAKEPYPHSQEITWFCEANTTEN